MLFQGSSDSLFNCSTCGHLFPQGLIEIPCPKCGNISFTPSLLPESESAMDSMAFRVSVRTSYSSDHIRSAVIFARKSAEIEAAFDFGHRNENGAFVMASIFAATAFLETTINELFADAAEDGETDIKKADSDVAALMANLWTLDVPRTASFSILKKYQIALALAKKESFSAGTSIYQNVDLVITLRNYLIHAEPENITWFTVGKIEPHKPTSRKLAEGLKGKFPVNKLMEGFGNPFFPDKCLGHGCAKWAIESCVTFTDEFFSKMGLKAPYDAFRNDLQ